MTMDKSAASPSNSQILHGKHAVVFGAGGSIGAAVAKEFAAQGAELFLSGHTKPGVESVTKQIAANGGRAHATVIRSEERRVGKEGRSRWAASHEQKNKS